MKTSKLIGTLLLFLCVAMGQVGTFTFEVASVKLNPSSVGRAQIHAFPTKLVIYNASLRACLQWAYDIRRDQIVSPEWTYASKYDIEAKTAEATTENQLRRMLQSLLAERLRMTVHRENRTLPVYELSVGKNGPNLTASKLTEDMNPRAGRGGYDIPHVSMSEFAARLEELGAVDLPVIDQTGLKGSFDISLTFPPGTRPSTVLERGASTFEILEKQLGLKLQLRKKEVEVLIVDAVERIPIEN